jgi:hypothetical protein
MFNQSGYIDEGSGFRVHPGGGRRGGRRPTPSLVSIPFVTPSLHVQSLGFGVPGLGFGVQGSGFRVQG